MPPRYRMKIKLHRQPLAGSWLFRTITESDPEGLGRLMLDAYRGTVDYHGETIEDALEEVDAVLRGDYGPFLKDCSFVIEDEDKLLSASMVVFSDDLEQPLLAFSMTHPEHKRKGMAKFLLKATINWLLDANYKELHLVVTDGNVEAVKLYEKLGFSRVEEPGSGP